MKKQIINILLQDLGISFKDSLFRSWVEFLEEAGYDVVCTFIGGYSVERINLLGLDEFDVMVIDAVPNEDRVITALIQLMTDDQIAKTLVWSVFHSRLFPPDIFQHLDFTDLFPDTMLRFAKILKLSDVETAHLLSFC